MKIGREIKETWTEIKQMEIDGSFQRKFSPGDYKSVDFGEDGLIRMRVAGYGKDCRADGYSIPVSWIARDVTAKRHKMHHKWFGEYSKCDLRKWLNGELYDRLPDDLKQIIIPTLKRQIAYTPEYDSYTDEVVDKLWIPSFGEVFEGGYPDLFSDDESRAMASWWWLRSASYNDGFINVYSDGGSSIGNSSTAGALALGFST